MKDCQKKNVGDSISKKNNYMKNRDYYLAYYKQWRQNKIKSDYELL